MRWRARRRAKKTGQGPIAQALLARLQKETDTPKGARVERIYAGYWQRTEGAWSWACYGPDGQEECGSQYTMKECLAADTWDWNGNELIPIQKAKK